MGGVFGTAKDVRIFPEFSIRGDGEEDIDLLAMAVGKLSAIGCPKIELNDIVRGLLHYCKLHLLLVGTLPCFLSPVNHRMVLVCDLVASCLSATAGGQGSRSGQTGTPHSRYSRSCRQQCAWMALDHLPLTECSLPTTWLLILVGCLNRSPTKKTRRRTALEHIVKMLVVINDHLLTLNH